MPLPLQCLGVPVLSAIWRHAAPTSCEGCCSDLIWPRAGAALSTLLTYLVLHLIMTTSTKMPPLIANWLLWCSSITCLNCAHLQTLIALILWIQDFCSFCCDCCRDLVCVCETHHWVLCALVGPDLGLFRCTTTAGTVIGTLSNELFFAFINAVFVLDLATARMELWCSRHHMFFQKN